MAIHNANQEFEAKAKETERQRQGWESAQRNYENQIADLTARCDELTKNLTELDEMAGEERDQLQTTLLSQSKGIGGDKKPYKIQNKNFESIKCRHFRKDNEEAISKLTTECQTLRKIVVELETDKESLERGWSDRFIQIEADWKDRLQKSQRDNERFRVESDQVSVHCTFLM